MCQGRAIMMPLPAALISKDDLYVIYETPSLRLEDHGI